MNETPDRPEASLKPPDPTRDHFERLGLARSHAIDRAQLEAAYLAGSKRVHPDRFVGSDDRTRRWAMEHTSLLNEAYRVLKGSVSRAEYLVRLAGIDLDSSEPGTGAPHPSQSFLVEMIERREALESATVEGPEALDALRDAVEAEARTLLSTAVGSLNGEVDVHSAARALVARRYLARLLEEIETAEEALS